MIRSVFFAFGLFAMTALNMSAQSATPADSAKSVGYREGRLAGGKPEVTGRAVGAFFTGIPLGFIAPFAIFGRNTLSIALTGAAAGGVIALAEEGKAAPPDSLLARARLLGPAYAAGFASGYEDRLKSRRKKAAYGAGAVGTAAGVGTLFVVIVFLFDDYT